MNIEKKRYDNHGVDEIYHLTEEGIIQSEITGKYLAQFGPFDAIYSSPRHRCLETLKHIMKHIIYPDDVQFETDDLLLEPIAGIINCLTHSEANNIINKFDDLNELKQKLINEKNPFIKIEIGHEYDILYAKYIETSTQEEYVKKYILFLEKLKKLEYKNILVVCHSGTIQSITKIVTNISPYNYDIITCPSEILSGKKIYAGSNCSIMALQYHHKSDKYELVVAPNTFHLEKLLKESKGS